MTEDFTTESSRDLAPPQADQHTLNPGAFFPNAESFVVAGGSFKSITNVSNHACTVAPADFRTISLGDLDLRDIRVDCASVAGSCEVVRRSARRMYSVRVPHSRSSMTAALYQGDEGEEQWKNAVSQYMALRHPRVLQVYGTVNCGGVRALVFHDDLVSVSQILVENCRSTMWVAYFHSFVLQEFLDAAEYIGYVFGEELSSGSCTLWMRPSTKRVCVELTPSEPDFLKISVRCLGCYCGWKRTPRNLLYEPNQVEEIISATDVADFHAVYHDYLPLKNFVTERDSTIEVGVVRHVSNQESSGDLSACTEVAFMAKSVQLGHSGWLGLHNASMLMPNGWTRLCTHIISPCYHYEIQMAGNWDKPGGDCVPWLAQANYIFSRLGITSGYMDYVLTSSVCFCMSVSRPPPHMPHGFLFLCPPEDFQVGARHVRCPPVPAYWSLDEDGAERLNAQEAVSLGFPRIDLNMRAYEQSWNEDAYQGLRQFYRSKLDLDADTQDVAHFFGVPLFEVSDKILAGDNGPESHRDVDRCVQDVNPNDEGAQLLTLPDCHPPLPDVWVSSRWCNALLAVMLFLILVGLSEQF